MAKNFPMTTSLPEPDQLPPAARRFRETWQDIKLISSVAGQLSWDQQTGLPPAGRPHRGEQLAWLRTQVHQRISAETLWEDLGQWKARPADPDNPTEQKLIALLERSLAQSRKLPAEFVQTWSKTTSRAQGLWLEARQKKDFALFRPVLEELVELARQKAALYQEDLSERENRQVSLYGALFDQFEPGTNWDQTRPQLLELGGFLKELNRKLAAAGPVGNSSKDGEKKQHYLNQNAFDVDGQKKVTRFLAEQMGFNLEAGALGEAAHPFCIGITPGDTRLATRYYDRDLSQAIYTILHEGGHGLYEQNLPPELYPWPLGTAASLGIHESQSRLWENCVGRSRAFWEFFAPRLKDFFPGDFATGSPEEYYREVNTSRPEFIRVDSDEYQYNLHILLRTELEEDLIEGKLAVRELEAAWNAKFKDYFGREVPDSARGVLQDIHWSGGAFGYFPTYTLGNVYAASFFTAARENIPDLEDRIARGDWKILKDWLTENIHRRGSLKDAAPLHEAVTGKAFDISALRDYLTEKANTVYGF